MNDPTRNPSLPNGRRRAMISVAALIALFVVGLVCVGLVKVAFSRRVEVGLRERRSQAEWLAESGLDRAMARLAASTDYPGETWNLSAEEFGGRGTATVDIRVEKVADRPDRRSVHIQADYPAGSNLRARRSRDMTVALPSPPR